jgi:hypothetical protein
MDNGLIFHLAIRITGYKPLVVGLTMLVARFIGIMVYGQ